MNEYDAMVIGQIAKPLLFSHIYISFFFFIFFANTSKHPLFVVLSLENIAA
jgi:hypothetical protein